MMTLLDAKPAKSKRGIFKYIPLPIFILILIIIAGAVTYNFWDYPEERAVTRFLSTLEAGNVQQAYKLWKAAPVYQYSDFAHDWGLHGDYGKIKNFKVVYAKSLGSHTVRVWVEINGRLTSILVDRKSKGLSYPLPD
ncbi:MAG: hypothetical protein ACRD1I_03690 [Terriglobia bacterium]